MQSYAALYTPLQRELLCLYQLRIVVPIVAEDTEAHAFIIRVPCMQTSLLIGGVGCRLTGI